MQHPFSQPDLTLSPAQFAVLRDQLARYSGVCLDETRQHVLTMALSQRLATSGLPLETYIGVVTEPAGQTELQQLVELVLNHETFFFRNQPHMRALREVILPDLHRRKPPTAPLRIWSAGCATGEEPYSLAIIALETLGRPLPRPVEIWATDLSERALQKARAGNYAGRTLNYVMPEQRARYFEPHEGGWSVRNTVRALVHFERLNLMEQFPARAQDIDIIFCQNVTIYFQLATCRDLVQRFYEVITEGGWLFLGFSETLWNIFDGFRAQEIAGSFVYYRESQYRNPTTDTLSTARSTGTTMNAIVAGRSPANTTPGAQHNVRRRMLARAAAVGRSAAARASIVAANAPAQSPWKPPVSGPELIQRGRNLLDAGRAAEALEVLQHAPLDYTHAPQALALVARAHANRGDLDLAVAEARRALELDTLTTEAYLLLGILYMQQSGRPSAACPYLLNAVQQLERARYLEPDSALISFHLAEAYRQLDRKERARREYRNTLRKLNPYPPDTLLDGVAVRWIRETCQRYVTILA